jgi:hypothetical protein
VSGCLGLPGFSQEQIQLVAMWQLLGLGTQALGLFSEAVGERQDVFETASLHRAAPVAGGSAIGVLITD